MSRSRIPFVLALFAVALVAVPAAFANGRDHRAVRIQGVCTQQSTSKLKLSREDRRIEIEFEVDQNQNGVPWTVTLSRNDNANTSFIATTRAPSGSFEIRRTIAGRLGTDRITAVAIRASGETCTADSSAPNAKAASATPAANKAAAANYYNGNAAGDDHGHHSGGHS
jgi:hypothetical protein